MSQTNPESLGRPRGPKICPVCGKASYSAAGIHPQCSVKQADLKHGEELKAKQAKDEKAEKAKKKSSKSKQTTRWQKQCPECKVSLHVRKKKCDCGHSFDMG